MAVKVVKNSEP